MANYLKEREADVLGAYGRYQQYLRTQQQRFPAGAFALGTAEWWYDPADHKCPHDAWLESITITEPSLGERSEQRHTSIQVRLLGAYHDGYIELCYPRVYRYSLGAPAAEIGLGDWRYDEFTLSAAGHVIHEIEWAGHQFGGEGGRWVIEASDVEYNWLPK
jgi:hypothetical protein